MLARSLTEEMNKNGFSFENYEDLPTGCDHRDVPMLVEQMESVWKLKGSRFLSNAMKRITSARACA